MTLREAIKEKGFTQLDVAKKLKITRRSLINKLNGDSVFKVLERRKLSRMLGYSVRELEGIINER